VVTTAGAGSAGRKLCTVGFPVEYPCCGAEAQLGEVLVSLEARAL
jgi:hypothetical protein